MILLWLLACGSTGGPPWARDTGLRGMPDPTLAMPPRCLEDRCWALSLGGSGVRTRTLALDGEDGAWAMGRMGSSVQAGDLTLEAASSPATYAVHWRPADGTVEGFAWSATLPGAVAAGPDGDVFAVILPQHGSSTGLAWPDRYLVRATPSGEIVWSLLLDGADVRDLRADGAGGVWAWTTAPGALTVGDEALPAASGSLLVHLDADGALTEHRALGDFHAVDVLVDGDTAFVSGTADDSVAFGAIDESGEALWVQPVLSRHEDDRPAGARPGRLALRDDGLLLASGSVYALYGLTVIHDLPDGQSVSGTGRGFVMGFDLDGTFALYGPAVVAGDVAVGPRDAMYVAGGGPLWALDPSGALLGSLGFAQHATPYRWGAQGDTLFLAGEHTLAGLTWGAVTLEGAGGFLLAVQVPE